MQVNKRVWKGMTEDQKEEFAFEVFEYYRINGFPYYPTDEVMRHNEMRKLFNYDYRRVIEDPNIKQSMHGLGLAWSYMPHSWSVRCNNMMTPLEAFNDDEIFLKVIRRRMQMGDNISDNGIRKMLKVFTGVQSVSNFRPTAAAAIYSLFSPKVIWDMSAGFGGRLLGAHRYGGGHYIGTDPSTQTFNGLVQMIDDFKMDAEVHKLGSEVFLPDKESLDMCFTSPPYFDTEKYSDEETQSYVKYPSHDAWINGYLKDTVDNCRRGLKRDGVLLLNIAAVRSFPKIEEETISVVTQSGFELVKTWRLALSLLLKVGYKYEPIFVFVKK